MRGIGRRSRIGNSMIPPILTKEGFERSCCARIALEGSDEFFDCIPVLIIELGSSQEPHLVKIGSEGKNVRPVVS